MTGQVADREPIPGRTGQYRIKLKVANRDLYGADFQWVDENQIAKREYPADVVVIERTEWGTLIGGIKEVRHNGQVVASGSEAGRAEVGGRLPEAGRLRTEIRRIEKGEIGGINFVQEQIRLKLRRLEMRGIASGPEATALQQDSLRRRSATGFRKRAWPLCAHSRRIRWSSPRMAARRRRSLSRR